MKLLGNIIWLLFGGIIISIEYLISGLLLCFTIIGIPFAMQVFKLGILALWPFGHDVVGKPQQGCLTLFMNLIWILIGGLWISITHLAFGILFCITIVGIPFGRQHFKLAVLALTPFGQDIK